MPTENWHNSERIFMASDRLVSSLSNADPLDPRFAAPEFEAKEFVEAKARILLALNTQSVANTHWHYSVNPLENTPAVYSVPSQCRHLTSDEQRIFQRALRRSVRVVSRGRLVNK